MKMLKISSAVMGIVMVSTLSGCIHVEDEGEARTTRTTTTTSGGVLTPSTTTVERTTVVDD